ncbi:MAG: DUF4405 domain-containing protein [Treponema sp.]|nr:DUF4405 domain-containing protein [Treponema sp.]
MNTNKFRMPLDILMTLLSIILMGGTMLFPNDRVHQICGIALVILWVVHIVFNRRWYGALFKGQYKPYRIMQLIVNCDVLICALLLLISGLLMAWFIPSEWVGGALGFARTTHLLASHWYYIFMAFHIGLHGAMLTNKCFGQRSLSLSKGRNNAAQIFLKIICIIISLYGIYAFIIRGVWKYMFGLQQFFFFDFERGYLLFALDYISIIVLFATIIHYIRKVVVAMGAAAKQATAGEAEEADR